MKALLLAVAITHVTLIDVISGVARPDVTVVVRGDRIESVGQAAPPKGATLVDGRGKFLIPGLWDMHVHLSWTRPSALPLLIANGVTSVRDLASSLPELDSWRTKIDAGILVGPRIWRAGPILNGKSFNKYQLVPGNPDATRGVARALKEAGVDFYKVHRRMERDSYFALIDEANKLGMTVVGHIPMTVTPEEASNAGQATIEHVATLFEGTFAEATKGKKIVDALRDFRTSGEAEKLFAVFVKNHTVFDPTIIAYQQIVDVSTHPETAKSPYIAASLQKEALPFMKGDDLAEMRSMMDEYRAIVGVAHRAGVTLVSGTDIASAPRVPGFMLHDELQQLVASGLTPAETLKAATINCAAVLKREKDLGSVEAGKLADMVLLDADPLADIGNTRKINAVIVNGKLYRRAKLDALLRDAERIAAAN
jgi:imidazolonepropionase-like amidohydrolase